MVRPRAPALLSIVVLASAGGAGIGALMPGPSSADKLSDALLDRFGEVARGESVEIIVSTSGPPADAAAHARDLGARVLWEYEVIDAFSARAPRAVAERIADLPEVEGVSLSTRVRASLDNSAQDVRAGPAWALGFDGAGVTVAIIDTGIDTLDPDLAGAVVACVATIEGVVSPECTDTAGHGTHVSGIVASRDPVYQGVAPAASLAAVRVLHAAGLGTLSDVLAGLDWVARNHDTVEPPIRVVNLSLASLSNACGDGDDEFGRAADALVERGLVVVAAAGNEGHDECTVNGAAAAASVITVGAADDRGTPDPGDDVLADFSGAGPTSDGRTKPELVAPGVHIWSLYAGPLLAEMSGTSMAAPHVAGAVALMLEQDPTLAPAQVKARLLASATAPTAAGTVPNDDWGHGLLNVCGALGIPACALQPADDDSGASRAPRRDAGPLGSVHHVVSGGVFSSL